MKNKRLLLPLFLLINTACLFGQEQLGLRLENYSGINAVFLNPAATISTPLKWDVNLVSAGFFLENNYAFVKKASALALLGQSEDLDLRYAGDVNNESVLPAKTFVADYFDDGEDRFISSLLTINGPSAMVKINQHTVGAFYNYRLAFSALDIPTNLSFYTYINRDFFDTFPVVSFTGSMMIWDEIGINYAYKIETNAGFLSIGANIKYLRGKEAAYFENINTFDLVKIAQDSIASALATFEYGLTTASLDAETFVNQTTGTGFGLDIGASATFGGYKDEGYTLKIGAALLDFGYIDFNQNAQQHRVQITQYTDISVDEFDNIQGITQYNELLEQFSEATTGSRTETLRENNFRMILPTGISLQADYSFDENIFLNATIVQGLPLGKPGIIRNNIIAITPRYEHRWFSVQMPLILHNYKDFRIGLAARVAFLIIGTDNIGNLVGRFSDFTGTDVYVGLRVNPFNTGTGDRYSGPGRKKLGRKGVKCYF
ncbi:MAG: hypothetical protein ACI85O_001270 [Saprospiraceae bacterium]|jgi:hypothetical protein